MSQKNRHKIRAKKVEKERVINNQIRKYNKTLSKKEKRGGEKS
jgi:hypothetical protein